MPVDTYLPAKGDRASVILKNREKETEEGQGDSEKATQATQSGRRDALLVEFKFGVKNRRFNGKKTRFVAPKTRQSSWLSTSGVLC